VQVPSDARVILLQNEIPESVNIAVAARKGAAKVILNAAPAREMSPNLLALVDILVVNRVEAADLLGVTDLNPMQPLDLGPKVVIVTLGGDGLVLHDGAPRHQAGHQVQVISTHGAGDAFLGALAARLDAGDDLPSAAAFGQAAAALHVSRADRAITPAEVLAMQDGNRPQAHKP
jgi:ribokinase